MAKRDTTATPAHDHDDTAALAQEVRDLRNTINRIDSLVQETADTVDAFVEGARATLTSGRDLMTVYRLLGSINAQVDMVTDIINCEAEKVGANYRSGDDPDDLAERVIRQRWQPEEAEVTA